MDGVPPRTGSLAIGSLDDRMIAAMRLVLSVSAIAITWVDPAKLERNVPLASAVALLYACYSAALYALAVYGIRSLPTRITHWLDIGWYTALMTLTGGAISVFFLGFFFAIAVASFRWGYGAGLHATVAALFTFIAVEAMVGPRGADFERDPFLSRCVFLLVVGFMLAYWGGAEITLKRRLAFLKEVNTLSNLRFGVDHTTGTVLERLRAFYEADAGLIVIRAQRGETEYILHRATAHDPEAATRPEPVGAPLTGQLLCLPATHSVVHTNGRWSGPWRTHCYAYDPIKAERTSADATACETLAGLLDAESYVTVPLWCHGEVVGRMYLASRRRRSFDASDTEFLLQIVDQVVPFLENVRLVHHLASDAAESERQRIARDIHDSIIQPYIGLQTGLAAIYQKLARGSVDVTSDMEYLINTTSAELDDVRNYVQGLKDSIEHEGSLLPAVCRFVEKFSEMTGIIVQVEAQSDIQVHSRLAAEVFQMVAEGLSNIRRHTRAAQAVIGLRVSDDHFYLRIENSGEKETAQFTPRSLTERTRALGGKARVEPREEGGVAVVIEIPL